MSGAAKIHAIIVHSVLLAFVTCWPQAHTHGQEREESETQIITTNMRPTDAKVSNLESVAKTMIQLTNEFRKTEGHAELKRNPELDETADYFANFMATEDKYGHTADDNRPSQRAKKHGYEFCIVLENIAYQYSSVGFEADQLARGFVEGWKKSPEHRKNMLDPDIRETGVSIARSDETGYYYAVQMFGRHRSDAIRFQIANQAGVTVHYKIGEQSFELETRYTRTHELCRPSTLNFQGTEAKDTKPDAILEPLHGDAFVVSKNGEGGVSIEQVKSQP